MTDTGRAKSTRRKRGGSQAIFAAVVFFGVIASVILLLTDSVQWLRLGIVTSLWAAVVGAFAMTKYRRDSASDKNKARDLQTVYELQLEREIAARREYELGVEARVRGEIGADASELRALRTELAALRRSLQMLFDGDLPEDRTAIAAEALRMRELAERSYSGYQPAPSGLYVPGRIGSGDRGRSEIEPEPGYGDPPFATPHDEPVTAETSVIHGEFDASGAFHPAPHSDSPDLRQEVGVEPELDPRPVPPQDDPDDAPLYTDPGFDRNAYGSAPLDESPFDESPFEEPRFDEPRFDESADRVSAESAFESNSYDIPPFEPVSREPEPVSPEPVEPEAVAVEPDADPEPAETRRSHRRAAEDDDASAGLSGAHSSGRSVADILAGMQSGDGASEPQAGRRRRRAD